MKRFVCIVALCLLVVPLLGCSAHAGAKICTLEANVQGDIHEWRGVGATFDCEDANPPCSSSLTVGFATVGSDITLGGAPTGIGVDIGVTWGGDDE